MTTSPKYITKISNSKSFNYIDIDTLTQYVTEQGKILPRRLNGLTAKKQRKITKQIKKARLLSLIPFVNK
uniref:Ribosomal protein S18 n=1 Tax=Porolithon onkodes TaxID=231751 RepID=A0A2Z2KXR6_9FLOR|nr:ribosomal protein S18 [Porolithon onkodes]ASB29752.1 ribosomal protein S18 [Porolithon onkodes]